MEKNYILISFQENQVSLTDSQIKSEKQLHAESYSLNYQSRTKSTNELKKEPVIDEYTALVTYSRGIPYKCHMTR